MKKTAVLLFFLVTGVLVYGQDSNNIKPFIIDGQLKNCKDKQITLGWHDTNGEWIYDTADVGPDGTFHLESNKVTKPMSVSLQLQNSFFTSLYAAPGYKLHITADCTDRPTESVTKQVTGYGATANQYLFKQDSIGDRKEYYKLNPSELLVYANHHKKLCDSLFNVVYGKGNNTDEYYDYFKKKIQLNNEFQRIDMLTYGIAGDTTLNYKQTVDYVNKNIKKEILENLFQKDFLISDAYVSMMDDGYYIYLLKLEKKKGIVPDNKRYRIDAARIIAENYKGKIKDMALYSQLYQAVEFARSFEELNLYKKEFPPYMTLLERQSERDAINKMTQMKEGQLLKTQVGRPAPAFTASDKDGKVYSIADYKGKVVLLDLWASWCEPCRGETPYLKKVVEKYKSEPRLAFISVAVLDKKPNWENAMKQDKPTWLQLFDSNSTVQSAYVANSIPKFIIIDKQGNIVSFDAPMPHEAADLEKILDQEIAK